MSITRFVTPVALVVGMVAVATPAVAQRGGGHDGAVSRGRAVARSRPVIVPRTVIVNRGYYRPYYRPYYTPFYRFVPRVSLGIGLWAGYPVTWSSYYYPYAYGYPYSPYYYGYPQPAPQMYPYGNYPYGSYPSTTYPPSSYPSSGYPATAYPPDSSSTEPSDTVNVEPGSAPENTGGVSFEIEPSTASVFIDGKYMGTGAEFGPNVQPLGLTAGHHRVEIRAEGYESMTFDADVAAGEVTPYKASLRRR